MHELALGTAIVDTVVAHADERKVTAVYMRIGRLRQVVPDSLLFYFEILSKDTVVEGARLELELIPARLRCAPCAREWEVDMPAFRCPTCSGADVTAVSGEEFEVESIDVSDESDVSDGSDKEAACTAPR